MTYESNQYAGETQDPVPIDMSKQVMRTFTREYVDDFKTAFRIGEGVQANALQIMAIKNSRSEQKYSNMAIMQHLLKDYSNLYEKNESIFYAAAEGKLSHSILSVFYDTFVSYGDDLATLPEKMREAIKTFMTNQVAENVAKMPQSALALAHIQR